MLRIDVSLLKLGYFTLFYHYVLQTGAWARKIVSFFTRKIIKNHPSVFVIGGINLHLKLMTIINTKQENTTLNITNPKTKPKLEDTLFKYENGYHSFVESLYIRKLYTGIYRSYEHQNQEHIPIGCVVVT